MFILNLTIKDFYYLAGAVGALWPILIFGAPMIPRFRRWIKRWMDGLFTSELSVQLDKVTTIMEKSISDANSRLDKFIEIHLKEARVRDRHIRLLEKELKRNSERLVNIEGEVTSIKQKLERDVPEVHGAAT